MTVSLDDEIYRRARMRAAERDTSVSALVREFLIELGSGESEIERLKREERALRDRVTAFRASDRLSRDKAHERGGVSPHHFLDTNILLYSLSGDPAEARNPERAIGLIEEDGGALSVQVLQEFYVQASRPTRPDPLPHDIAAGLIRTWTRFPVQEITVAILNGALEIKAARGFSYWDCAIIAAA